mmetsp:Transcript_8537/g.34958  ORF Transcript_8537/g.34958 Transcript_8537/m.34958 type:complete len:213 (-) Transcript_8537:13-651(-)
MAMQSKKVDSTMTSRRRAARWLWNWSSSVGAKSLGSKVPGSFGASSTATPAGEASSTGGHTRSSSSSWSWSSGASKGARRVRSAWDASRLERFEVRALLGGGGGALLRCCPRYTAAVPAHVKSTSRAAKSARRSPVPSLNVSALVRFASSDQISPSRFSRVKYSTHAHAQSTRRMSRSVTPFFSCRRRMLSWSVRWRKKDARAIVLTASRRK